MHAQTVRTRLSFFLASPPPIFPVKPCREPVDEASFDISAPCLPRKRCAPACYEVGSSACSFHDYPEDYYWQIYFVALDHAIEAIHDRFNQPGCRIYQNLEQLIVKACKGEPYSDELDQVCNFFMAVTCIHDIVKALSSLSS